MNKLIVVSRWATIFRNQRDIFDSFDEIIVFSSSRPNKKSLDNKRVMYYSIEEVYKERSYSYSGVLANMVKSFIIRNKNSNYYLLSFFPLKVNYGNVKLLQPQIEIASWFESKKNFHRIMNECGINIDMYPRCIIPEEYGKYNYNSLKNALGTPFIVQTDSSGGRGTKIISSKKEWNNAHKKQIDRISQFVDGYVYNFNVVNIVENGKIRVLIESPSFKPMRVDGLYNNAFSSYGNEWGMFKINNIIQVIESIKQIGYFLFEKYYYIGIWGVDCIVDRNTNNARIIEINARIQGTTEVASVLQKLRREVSFVYRQVNSFISKSNSPQIFDDDLYNQHIVSYPQYGAFYVKIKYGSDIIFNPSFLFEGDGIYKFKNGMLHFINDSIQTIDAIYDDSNVLIVNSPTVGDVIRKGIEICTVEAVKLNHCTLFQKDETLSYKGKNIIRAVFDLLGLKTNI